MKVSIKLLATYRKYLPPETKGSSCEVNIPAGVSPKELLTQFNVPLGKASVVLVNGRMPDPNYVVTEGDVVCAFPAEGGG